MSIIKQELKRVGMEDIWESGRNIDKKGRIRIRKICVDADRQNLEATVREGSSLTLCNISMRNW
jgi:hypothetical protein